MTSSLPKQQHSAKLRQRSPTPREKRKPKGYPTIPLQYDDLAVHRECRDKQVVYRGLHPKRSQIYFKTLVDIDWDFMRDRKTELVRDIAFDSRFEGGNLHYAVKINDREYDLYMRVDTNTAGHKMWFFFKITNRKANRLKLNILRFPKFKSLYQRGLKPFVFSKKHFLATSTKWEQQGQNLTYYEDNHAFLQRTAYALSFEYQFMYDNDEVFIATLPPFSYSYMLKSIKDLPVKHSVLCKSLGGL